jgi:hypothetical protein
MNAGRGKLFTAASVSSHRWATSLLSNKQLILKNNL